MLMRRLRHVLRRCKEATIVLMLHARPVPAAPVITTPRVSLSRALAVALLGIVLVTTALLVSVRLGGGNGSEAAVSSGSGVASGGSNGSGSGQLQTGASAAASTQPTDSTSPGTPSPSPSTTPVVETDSTTTSTSTYVQESSSAIAYAGTWGLATSSSYSGGHAKYSKAAGASATLTFTGYHVTWVGPVGPTRGKAKIYVNGVYNKTVDLYASSFVARKAIWSSAWATQATRKVKIVVAGTAGRPTVAIDNFVVFRVDTTPLPGYPDSTVLRYLSTPSAGQPAYLSPVRDSILGTTTVRVSNTNGVRQSYARLSAWNRDGSKLLLAYTYPGRMLDGHTFALLGSFPQISQAIWSNVDPNKLYGISGNALYRQNATTAAITRIHTFSAYASLTIGDYEGGISDDDRYIVLIGTTSGGTRQLLTYDLVSDAVVGTMTVTGINNAQISRKGNYVVVVNNAVGTANGQGVERYNRDFSSRLLLTAYPRHGDNALDANGNEIYVANNAPNVVAFQLSTGAGTRLLPGTTAYEYGHVSGRNLDRPGWVYLSVFDNSATAGRPGHDQVIAVKTDGSGTVEVFAFSHHSGTVYASQPQAVPSPDGRRVLFASEWGGSSVYAYVAFR